jgi:hypothetical protein
MSIQIGNLSGHTGLGEKDMTRVIGGGNWVPVGARVRCMAHGGCGIHQGRMNKHYHYGRQALKGQAEGYKPQVSIKYMYINNRGILTRKTKWGGWR